MESLGFMSKAIQQKSNHPFHISKLNEADTYLKFIGLNQRNRFCCSQLLPFAMVLHSKLFNVLLLSHKFLFGSGRFSSLKEL